MPTIYFDACCLNRPFDDQSQDRIHLEAEAILIILAHVKSGDWQWISSAALEFEIEQIADSARRTRVKLLTSYAQRSVHTSAQEEERARELAKLGFHAFDALHLAYAETGQADVFLTTDDQLLRLASRFSTQLLVRVENPLKWIEEATEK
jgi:predicted nucleic acid-binding protein